jgi:UV DNA damage repair endonuclease
MVQDLHHKDVVSMTNLKMTPEQVLHSFVQLEARKTWSYMTPYFQGKEKKSSTKNQINDECVKDLLHQNAWL